MDAIETLPNARIIDSGQISRLFLKKGITSFLEACQVVHAMPYGYNSDNEDLCILFKEGQGTCITKHSIIATLAHELGLAVNKHIGVYAMTESLVTGTNDILETFNMPYLPMTHCFLVSGENRVDLTEGNNNGKNGPIDDYLHVEPVIANISDKDEYFLYRTVVENQIIDYPEFSECSLTTILKARQKGLLLLKANVKSVLGM